MILVLAAILAAPVQQPPPEPGAGVPVEPGPSTTGTPENTEDTKPTLLDRMGPFIMLSPAGVDVWPLEPSAFFHWGLGLHAPVGGVATLGADFNHAVLTGLGEQHNKTDFYRLSGVARAGGGGSVWYLFALFRGTVLVLEEAFLGESCDENDLNCVDDFTYERSVGGGAGAGFGVMLGGDVMTWGLDVVIDLGGFRDRGVFLAVPIRFTWTFGLRRGGK